MWYLKLKHWQIFCLLIPAMIMQNFTLESHEQATIAIRMTGYLIYIMCPLFMGDALYNIAGKRFDLNHNFFMINALIVFATCIIPIFIGQFHVTGLAALPFLYVVFAFFYYIAYPAKALKAIETSKDVSVSDYAGDFFLILFFPIGVWFIQPRLNKIAELQMLANNEQTNS